MKKNQVLVYNTKSLIIFLLIAQGCAFFRSENHVISKLNLKVLEEGTHVPIAAEVDLFMRGETIRLRCDSSGFLTVTRNFGGIFYLGITQEGYLSKDLELLSKTGKSIDTTVFLKLNRGPRGW
jgi:hypothetical protein